MSVSDVIVPIFTMAQIAVAMWMFAMRLPKRDGFGVRVAVLVAGIVIACFVGVYVSSLIPSGDNAYAFLYTEMPLFAGILLVSIPLLLFLYDTTIWCAMFCCCAGYATQNFWNGAKSLLEMIGHQTGLWAVYNVFIEWAVNIGVTVLIYWIVWRLWASKVNARGLASIRADRSMLVSMIAVFFFNILFPNVLKVLVVLGTEALAMRLTGYIYTVGCLVVIYLLYEMVYNRHLQLEETTNARAQAERERQLEASRISVEAINRRMHDIRHQVLRMLDDADADLDRELLADVAREVRVYATRVNTGNETVDLIVNEKRLACEEHGVELSVIADGRALAHLSPADLYALLGGMLEGARQGLASAGEGTARRIGLNVHTEMGMVSIHVEAPCVDEKIAHGAAWLRDTRNIAERYDGTLTASVRCDTLHVNALLPEA